MWTDCIRTTLGKQWKNLIKDYKKDAKTNEMLENVEAYPGFTILQNKLYCNGQGRMQLYIPEGTYRDLVMRKCHDAKYAGHLGMKKTTELIQRDFYWLTPVQDVEDYMRTCKECQCNKANNQRPLGLFSL